MSKETWDNINKLSTSSRVLRYVFRNAPVSRAGIADALNLSPAMATNLTNHLLNREIIENLGETISGNRTPGRKRILIGLKESNKVSIGVDISVECFTFCITDLLGKMIYLHQFAPTQEQIMQVTNTIITYIHSSIQETQVIKSDIIGIGIALPGHYIQQTGEFITHSTIWKDFNAKLIEEKTALSVTCDNNVRTMAYSKYLFDKYDCPENFAFIHAGAGIFCAIFNDGKLSTGDNYIAGEIGHTVSNPDGQHCECGKTGCLQTYASESWILKKAKTIYQSSSHTILHSLASAEEKITIQTVLTAYQLGDKMVSMILVEALKYLGISIANIAIITSPQKIFLHSRLLENKMIQEYLQTYIESQLLFVQKSYMAKLCMLRYDNSLAGKGAAAMAIDRLFIYQFT